MRWVDNRQLPIESHEVVSSGERWVVNRCGAKVDIQDRAGNNFYFDKSGRCYVNKGPMLDIFGNIRTRVEIPDPLCQCSRDVVTSVLTRRVD